MIFDIRYLFNIRKTNPILSNISINSSDSERSNTYILQALHIRLDVFKCCWYIRIFEDIFWGRKHYFSLIEWIRISMSDIADYFHATLKNFRETTSGHTNLQFLVTRFCIHLETSWCTYSFTRYWVFRNTEEPPSTDSLTDNISSVSWQYILQDIL